MKILMIINAAPYGREHMYNGLRLGGSLAKRDETELKVFLIGASVGTCGSCLDARAITDTELVEGAHRSSMEELTNWTLEADKVISFSRARTMPYVLQPEAYLTGTRHRSARA